MDFLVENNNVKWTRNDNGSIGCWCQSTFKGSYIFSQGGRPLYRLSSEFPHTINGDEATTYQEFQDLWTAAGGLEYDSKTLRKYISETESEEITFTNVEIEANDDTTWRDGGDQLYNVTRIDNSGYSNDLTQSTESLQPFWDDVNKISLFDGTQYMCTSMEQTVDSLHIEMKTYSDLTQVGTFLTIVSSNLTIEFSALTDGRFFIVERSPTVTTRAASANLVANVLIDVVIDLNIATGGLGVTINDVLYGFTGISASTSTTLSYVCVGKREADSSYLTGGVGGLLITDGASTIMDA